MFDDFYWILSKKIKILFKIKSTIYDVVCNLTDLTYLEFNFYYLKYGSNLHWIKNVVNFNYLDKNFKNYFLKFLKKKSKKIKNLEIKYSTKSYNLIKILNYIESKKIKIDIMRNKIIKLKLNIVNSLTIKYKKNNFYNDCFQEGCMSLIKSVNIYNINLNYGFEDFLEYNIKKSVNCFMYNANRIIKIPPHISEVLKKINIFRIDYKKKYNSEPSTEYISESLNININKVKKILTYNKVSISMNKIIDGEEYEDYFEQINNNYNQDFEKDIFYIIMKNQLSKLIKKKGYKKYPNLINMRYGLKKFKKYKLKEISNMYNISRNKASMLQKKALESIKFHFKNI
ncbi:sigma-70 family RNA polymerase sigma factor [Candidatus Nasuia deltocephalinicola]|uniref:sigma-70 family RNA polymerase sigma factor n=1 Tax=Candidatus Nasuia deltocephalincola TaxID=1160784 RepID=UPI00216AB6DD|nr:sigma-70 family RNA polymerase sigma factor [Candidatus Nasuia deltocephalinicola]